MSFPVQVLVVGDELRPAVEAVCRRLQAAGSDLGAAQGSLRSKGLGATETVRVAYQRQNG